MHLEFREDRVTQAAAEFLRLRGKRMSYLKLMKLLYLADREALLQFGRPISYDRHCAMEHGPVLSRTLDLIRGEPTPGATPGYWRTWISLPLGDFEVELKDEAAPTDQLSRAEFGVIRAIFDQFGHMTRWELKDYTHKHLPEYKFPGTSSHPIPIQSVLRGGGADADQIEAVIEALFAEKAAAAFAG